MPIPTNLITGFLGSGKTTAINRLLTHRPDGERWSIFVNEYGMVTVDEMLIDSESPEVSVQELGGGCLCCTVAFAFDAVFSQFIRRSKPDRLFLEPSGAGHPAALIDKLRDENFRRAIDLRATICLVDPEDWSKPQWRDSEVFHDQVQMADVVAINFTDKRDPKLTQQCREWIESFDPPKMLIVETDHGRIDPAWLDIQNTVVRPPKFGEAHSHNHSHAAGHVDAGGLTSIEVPPMLGKPKRIENEGDGQWACGWIFSVDEVFDRDQLLDLLGYLQPVVRLKGVFRCQDDWWVINRSKNETSFSTTAYRRDSRLEVITDRATSGWDEVEQLLLKCK
ncbi:CobW family GTP-binding protein [Rhodopirellula baltica]|uniref:Cobalamin synthesis protein, P47K n=1 Tax=Rhodopirellula baltica SWK14 TaxID=993516 RepID=L7CGP9_RHOBT|nr:GTP-binding protein [Rhodopirellula baltica]ELP33188.1 cobalamin synthesis protein, P47K [Rhodopirellula baltica SWK14]